VIDEVKTETGKWIFVARGRVFAEVAKQPKDQPMIFASPFGEAKVLGTTLRLLVDPTDKGSMRLEVEEGKVQLKNLAGRTVDVPSGHYAVAVAGGELATRTLPIQEILLLAVQGKRAGEEWRVVKDDKAASGSALEALTAGPRATGKDLQQEYVNSESRIRNRTAAYVEFKFVADADRDYTIWVRGSCLAVGNPAYDQALYNYDQVLIELPTGQLSRPIKSIPNMHLVNGHAVRSGYWWVGGDAWTDENATPPAKPQDNMPVTVRFNRPGPQFLRLYAAATVQRIDAIWLSATQKTRPDDKFTGPGTATK
jgi:FecR-like protein